MLIQFKKNIMGVILLGKIKIYEIAKKLGLASKDVLDMAKELNIDVKSHMSGVDENEAKKIEESISKKTTKQASTPKQTTSKKEEKAPVIIRREVIITD